MSEAECYLLLQEMIRDGDDMNFIIRHKTVGLGRCRWPQSLSVGRYSFPYQSYTPLIYAIVKRNKDLVKLLVESLHTNSQPGALEAPIKEGLTALMVAALVDNPYAIDVLIPHVNINQQDNSGNTALMHAIHRGNRMSTNIILNKVPLPWINNENHIGDTPLMLAIKRYQMELAADLIDAGADPNKISTTSDSTALEVAVVRRSPALVFQMLMSGSDPNIHRGPSTPLAMAAFNKQLTSFDMLLEAGADLNHAIPPMGSPLCVAAYAGSANIVKMALANEALINITYNKLDYDAPEPYEWLNQVGIAGHGPPAYKRDSSDSDSDDGVTAAQELWHKTFKDMETAAMTLVASGEDVSSIRYFSSPAAPQELQDIGDDKSLTSLCRDAVRNHLLKLDAHTNLFMRVNRLGLPPPLQKYILYDQDLTIDTNEGQVERITSRRRSIRMHRAAKGLPILETKGRKELWANFD